jgi:2'-5' RNA ligase
MTELIRSFIAFDITDEKILKNISDAQAKIIETGADLKLVEPKNIHATLRFLGEISPIMVDKVYEEMKKISFSPFDFELRGVGVFPNLQRISVVWIGIVKGVKELTDIFSQLEPRICQLGFPPERRGFSPHMTIARVKSGRNKTELTQQIMSLKDYEFGVIRADCLKLKKSVLTPQGPIYSSIYEVRV